MQTNVDSCAAFAPRRCRQPLAFARPPAADDWPQWQGPDRNAVSKETGLLKEWPKDGPPLAWKANGIGEGMGGIAVSQGRIYTTGDDDDCGLALRPQRGRRQAGCGRRRSARGGNPGNMIKPSGPRCHPDGRRRPDLRPQPGRRPGLLHDRRQGSLAHQLRQGLRRHHARSGASPSRRWSTATSSSAPPAPGRDADGPRQADRQADLEVQGARRPHAATGASSARPARPTPRPSPSTSTASASTCSSPPRRSSASRRPTASSSGGTTRPPTAPASTAPRRSTTTAWCSPPRPTTRAAGW